MRKRTLERTMIVVAGAAMLAIAITRMNTPGVMPFSTKAIEDFQQANGRIAEQMLKENDGKSVYEINAISFRQAVSETGFSPDKTLLYWMSPEFKADVSAGNPNNMTDSLRLCDSLLQSALGDGASDDEFTRIIAMYSSEVQTAARKRRGG